MRKVCFVDVNEVYKLFKKKKINLVLISDCDTVDDYNKLQAKKKLCLTKQGFDLLKEMVL